MIINALLLVANMLFMQPAAHHPTTDRVQIEKVGTAVPQHHRVRRMA